MPFTPAHTAIVLPFVKGSPRYVSATALVAGSVSPDFEYFFKMSVNSLYSHTVAGLFWFDLPVALLISWVFHVVVKDNLVDNFPGFLHSRFLFLKEVNFMQRVRQYPMALILSAIFGAMSHIFWDAFTHNNAFFVRNLAFYERSYIPFMGVKYPLWYGLQHISTFVGLAIVVIYVCLMPTRTGAVVNHRPQLRYWLLIVVIMVAVVILRFSIRSSDFNPGNLIVTCITGFCVALVATGMFRFDRRNPTSS